MPEISFDFSVYCGTCGNGLCGNTRVDQNRSNIHVDVCDRCIKEKDNEIENLQSEISDLNEEIEKIKIKEADQI